MSGYKTPCGVHPDDERLHRDDIPQEGTYREWDDERQGANEWENGELVYTAEMQHEYIDSLPSNLSPDDLMTK